MASLIAPKLICTSLPSTSHGGMVKAMFWLVQPSGPWLRLSHSEGTTPKSRTNSIQAMKAPKECGAPR